MATQAEMVQRIYDYLYGTFPTESPFLTKITVAYNSAITTITVTDGDNWDTGDILENAVTGEQMYVMSVSGNVLTVIRGHNGTTAAASSGSSDTVAKNPRFSQSKVNNAIASTLQMLEGWGVHGFATGALTRADPAEFYELTETDIVNQYGVIKVYEVDENYEFPRALPFRWQYSLGVGVGAYTVSGHGIHVLDWGTRNNGEDVFYVYAMILDDVTELSSRQEELVVIGATALLMGGTIAPATHDPGARSDRTVQPGQTSRDVRYFQGRFYTEARMESALLAVARQKMMVEGTKTRRARNWVG